MAKKSYLAIDYGTRRIGLAWADELGIAQPLPAITSPDPAVRWAELDALRERRRPTTVILGWPLREDGSPGTLAPEIEAFEAELIARWGVPVQRVDETLTSVDAGATMPKRRGTGKARARAEAAARRTGEIDSRAAAILLQDWLGRGPM